MKKTRIMAEREMLTGAYEVRAFRDDPEAPVAMKEAIPEVPHAEPGAFEQINKMVKGHGDQTVLPDDCQDGDNDRCDVDA